ncbi:MAG: HAMP domain-containing histidine kinase, partial [Pseudomonadota bacterium]|nr:HAMP domain-containing histidine kinase [Pseudomonadota bacterium]
RFAGKLQSRLQHLERLVSHMLIFARGGALPGESLPLAGLAAELRQAMEPALAAAGGSLEVADGAAGARVLGNREALLAALQNLGHNALQAGARRLRLILAPGGADAWDVALADDGPGIPEAVQARVFEPFFTTRPQGTGLGLAVVRAIAAAHNGAVWLDSTPVSGCCVTLRLPRQATAETPL